MIRYVVADDNVALMKDALRSAGISLTSRVLNIACEFHRVPRYLVDTVSDANVNGIEINRSIIEKDPLVRYCNVDEDAFPFEKDTFDLALSVFGVEHFKTDNVFREAWRTLKPGGTFLFLVPNVCYPAFLSNRILGDRFANWYYRHVMRERYQPHKAYYRFNSLGSIRRTSNAVGFRRSHITFFGPANILLYTRRLPAVRPVVYLFERLLNNQVLYRFKPYILVGLEK